MRISITLFVKRKIKRNKAQRGMLTNCCLLENANNRGDTGERLYHKRDAGNAKRLESKWTISIILVFITIKI